MKTSSYTLIILLLIGLFDCNQLVEDKETATKGNLLVCCAESHYDLIQSEADQFNSLYNQANVSVFGAMTREAIVFLLNDSVKAIISDRKLNAEEQEIAKQAELNFEEIKIAKDAMAVVVNPLNGITSLSLESLKNILMQKITNWSQLPDAGFIGPIEIVLTGRNSGTYELIKNYFFNLAGEIPVTMVFDSQKEVVDYVAKRPQTIGLVSIACHKNFLAHYSATDSTQIVRALAFAGVDSTGHETLSKLHQANIHLERYPLHYPVYMYFKKKAPLARGFFGFIAGATGQKIILNWGLVPVTMPVRIVTIT